MVSSDKKQRILTVNHLQNLIYQSFNISLKVKTKISVLTFNNIYWEIYILNFVGGWLLKYVGFFI
jgi:hypothetical protein